MKTILNLASIVINNPLLNVEPPVSSPKVILFSPARIGIAITFIELILKPLACK
jgi:hypothetical protein